MAHPPAFLGSEKRDEVSLMMIADNGETRLITRVEEF